MDVVVEPAEIVTGEWIYTSWSSQYQIRESLIGLLSLAPVIWPQGDVYVFFR